MTERKKRAGFVSALSGIGNLQEPTSLSTQGVNPGLLLLRSWQSNRLKNTYADQLSSPTFGPACRFFLSDIYAPHEFSQRDHDFEYLYAQMSRFLPGFLLSLAKNAIEMNDLTKKLDQALVDVLVNKLGVVNSITPQLYGEAYRICDNYHDRVHQIEMIVKVGKQVSLGMHIPLVGTTLRLARGPAYRAGWHEAHDFFERGFQAFRIMGGKSHYFIDTIYQREMKILDRIFAEDPDPFSN